MFIILFLYMQTAVLRSIIFYVFNSLVFFYDRACKQLDDNMIVTKSWDEFKAKVEEKKV